MCVVFSTIKKHDKLNPNMIYIDCLISHAHEYVYTIHTNYVFKGPSINEGNNEMTNFIG